MSPRRDPGERLRRLLAMMPWLAARGSATFDEIAERFGIDVASVEDELLLASCCGLPPYSPERLIELTIDGDGVTARVPAYFRRPLRMTAADGFAILAAGEALLAVPGSDRSGPLATALGKLAAVLGGSRGVTVELDAPEWLAALRDAAERSEAVEVTYYSASSDEVTTRVIEPLSVFADRGRWYVAAFCRRAGEVLHFRVDRVRSLRPTGERFELDAGEAAGGGGGLGARGGADGGGGGIGSVFRAGPGMTEAVLVLPSSARWVVETYPTISVDEIDDGRLRVRLAVSSPRWLERLLLRVGPEGRVEAPAEWAELGADVARRLLARYADAASG